jgi:hypothetical protein
VTLRAVGRRVDAFDDRVVARMPAGAQFPAVGAGAGETNFGKFNVFATHVGASFISARRAITARSTARRVRGSAASRGPTGVQAKVLAEF